MEKRVCGTCALKADFNLAMRIHFANSRKLNVEYLCPECGNIHSWTFRTNGEEVLEQPIEIAETADIEEFEEAEEIYIQTRLF